MLARSRELRLHIVELAKPLQRRRDQTLVVALTPERQALIEHCASLRHAADVRRYTRTAKEDLAQAKRIVEPTQ